MFLFLFIYCQRFAIFVILCIFLFVCLSLRYTSIHLLFVMYNLFVNATSCAFTATSDLSYIIYKCNSKYWYIHDFALPHMKLHFFYDGGRTHPPNLDSIARATASNRWSWPGFAITCWYYWLNFFYKHTAKL